MLKGRCDTSTRKPRLFVESTDAKADGEGDDPIAAALAARKRKQEQALKAAAAAAAKAAAANVITYFADDTPVKPKQEQDRGSQVPTAGDRRPEASSNGLSEQQAPLAEESSLPAHASATSSVQAEAHDGGNPLASLLGYSGDDGSGSEAGDDTPERDVSDSIPEQQPASDDNDSSIDAELANFMEELESSGLLKEDSALEEPGMDDSQLSATATPSQPILAATSTPADANHSTPPAAAVTASAEDETRADSPADAALDASQGMAPAEDGAAAEQRVLGSLTGCPGWHEVMDMASGKVYFWNEESDEVAWEPPEGSQPRTEGENEAVFAAAHASPEATTAAPEIKSSPAGNEMASPPAGREDTKIDREEGELEARPADIPMPDEALEKAAQDLLAQSWAAAEQLCGPAPLLVRLAVEAEVRLRDWQALAAAQRQAAEASSAAGSLSWESYQSKIQAELELLRGALPGALQEAQTASASAAAAVAAATKQAEEAAQEDGEVSADADTHAAPPLPEEPQTAPADDTAMDMDITDDGPPPAASAPASMPATATPPAAATSATVSAPVLTTAQPATAPVPKAQPAAATPLTAQIDSRIAAAVAAHPAAGSAHSGPSASAALPRPYLAPLPALAPQWPGYYQPHPPYAYPHMPYPYMPYPMPYATPQMPQAASVPLPASIPQPAAPGEVASASESIPPLPLEEQPPLPSSAPEAAPPAASIAAPAKQKEYRAEPVRTATPPTPAEPPDQASAAAAAAAVAAPEEESRKRKLKKGAAASAKKRAAVKVGSLAPSVLNKWAAARKDLEDKEEGEEEMDAEAVERRRMREAEEWRLKQLRSGVSSQANSNFQPLAMDWREKIKAAKGKPAEAPKAAAVKAQPKKYTSKPDLESLSGGLPQGWKALWDKQSGEIYYGNPTTKETSWEKPE